MRTTLLILVLLALLSSCTPRVPAAPVAPAQPVVNQSPPASLEPALAAPASAFQGMEQVAPAYIETGVYATGTPAVLSGSGTLAPPQVTVVPPTPEISTPTALAPIISQLTQGGCCVQPFWSPDSRQVLFLDRPDAQSPAGIWGVPVTGGQPAPWTERLGIYSPDMRLRAYPSQGLTMIERMEDNQRWVIDNGGRSVSFSPDSSMVAWSSGQSGPPFDTAVRQVWVSRVDGTQARRVGEFMGGGFSGWLPDGRMLINSRLQAPESGQVIWALTLPAEPGGPTEQQELARGERLRSFSVSLDGSWLAYVMTSTADPGESGLFVVSTTTGQTRRIEPFGAYRWRDGEHLLLVPLDLSHPQHGLLQISAASGEVRTILEPSLPAFKIANGDWSVSPDGQWVVFLSANDQNLWLLALP